MKPEWQYIYFLIPLVFYGIVSDSVKGNQICFCCLIMSNYGFSDFELKIILDQIEQHAAYRKEYLKLRTDPCKHSQQAGYVFDPALQRFLSMKNCQVDHFQMSGRDARFGIFAIIMPMLALGTALWTQRTRLEKDRRSGKIRYKDRLFKFA